MGTDKMVKPPLVLPHILISQLVPGLGFGFRPDLCLGFRPHVLPRILMSQFIFYTKSLKMILFSEIILKLSDPV
jgi:hypothetical protein